MITGKLKTEMTREEVDRMSRLSRIVMAKGCCNCKGTDRTGSIRMIIPRSFGGQIIESNLYYICSDCLNKAEEEEILKKQLLSKAIKRGMQTAKNNGKQVGRKKLTRDTLPHAFYGYYVEYIKKEINKTEFAKKINVSRSTLNRYIKVYTGNR